MAVYDGNLYVGTWNQWNGCMVYRYDGSNWVELVGNRVLTLAAPGFNNSSNFGVASMAVRMGDLYFGTTNSNNGCELWRYDGAAMFEVVGGGGAGTSTGPGFGNPKNFEATSLATMGAMLYIGTFNNVTGCEVWSCDMYATWRQLAGGSSGAPIGSGFGDAGNEDAGAVACYSGHVYVGTHNAGGCQVWRYDGLGWIQTVGLGTVVTETAPGFDDVNNIGIWSSAVYKSSLFFGTRNDHSASRVFHTMSAPSWYLAEGASAGGFETWVLVQNPNADPVDVEIRYVSGSTDMPQPLVTIPGNSRQSFLMNSVVESYDVSTIVTAKGAGEVICERATYWTPPGSTERVLGTESIGVNNPAPTWYMAEGASIGGYETWILVQNPNKMDAEIDVKYQTNNGEVQGPHETLPANSRKSYPVQATVQDFDVSTKVSSLTPGCDIICERAVYWTPPGSTERVLGTSSIGATEPSTLWGMVEGPAPAGTRPGYWCRTPTLSRLKWVSTTRPLMGESMALRTRSSPRVPGNPTW